MRVPRVVEAPEAFVSLDMVRRHCRIDAGDDDETLSGMIAAACARLDGPTGLLGRALGRQTLELTLDGFGCGPLALPCPPIVSIVSVTYAGADGAAVVLDPALYRVAANGRLWPAPGKAWPVAACGPAAVVIRYGAGYPEDAPDLQAARLAACMLVGHWHTMRAAVAANTLAELPLAVSDLVSRLKVRRV